MILEKMMMEKNKPGRSAGFTLVELSISVILIGIILVMVIKGTELIQNTRFKKTITAAADITSAVMAFQQKYEALPGDMANAAARLPGCNASCAGGDGNRIIGIRDAGPDMNQTGVAMPAGETSLFWKHLAKADLLNSVDSEANRALPALGSTHPRTPMNGVFSVYNRNANSHGLSVKFTPDGAAGLLTPHGAMILDTMVDGDPSPSKGNLLSNGGTGCLMTETVFSMDDNFGYCYVMFVNLNF